MSFQKIKLKRDFILHNFNAIDVRSVFVKTYNNEFIENQLSFVKRESN